MSEPQLDASAKILILTPAANSHRKDFDFVFKPESLLLQKIYGPAMCTVERVQVAGVDPNTLKVESDQKAFERAARTVLGRLTDGTAWSHVMMMCHGWSTGVQLGFRSKKQRAGDKALWDELIAALKPVQVVTLFACSAGKEPLSGASSPGTGDDSFGDLLRDACGATVIAHTTVGHATRNPNLIIFERSATPVLGGIVPALKGSQLFKNAARLLQPHPPKPPQAHTRPAVASIPLCSSASELHALLSAPPR